MIDELKPCPFCGGEKMMALSPNCTKDGPYNPGDNAQPIVRCMTCFAEAMGNTWDFTKGSAVTAWNRRADLASNPQAAPVRVVVKPLEWGPEAVFLEENAMHSAPSPFGRYFANDWIWWGPNVVVSAGYKDTEHAKAAAQADYERRILSAIAGQS